LSSIRIGIDTVFLTGQMTGVGNASFELLNALIENHPDLEFLQFGRFRWSPFNAADLRRIERQTDKREEDTRPSVRQALRARVQREAAQLKTARAIYGAARRKTFSTTIASQSLDLFHALNFIPPADPGIVTLPVIHDLSFVRYPETHPQDRLRWLERLPGVLDKAPIVQTVSEFSRNEIASVYGYPKDRIFVAPNAAASIFRPRGAVITQRDLEPLRLAAGRYLLAVGTLEPRKNLSTLIAAYTQLSATERARAPLAIAGAAGWGDINLPRQTAGLVQDGSLRFLGRVTDAQLRSLYEGAIALLFPSVYEGFGMPVVEAMSCGTLAIHSGQTAMDEITANPAVAIAATDVLSWTEAMRDAIESPRTATQAVRQERIARAATFDWRTSAARVRKAYSELTG